MSDQQQQAQEKPKYENKPIPPPGGPYSGIVISEGLKRKDNGSLKKWVKVQSWLDETEYHAFLDVYATERSANTYLKQWCHAFGIPIAPDTPGKIFSGEIKHKGRALAYDIVPSDKPKADGSPFYRAAHPRRIGEPAPEFLRSSGGAPGGPSQAPPALTPEEAARLGARLCKESPAERQARAKAPDLGPQKVQAPVPAPVPPPAAPPAAPSAWF